MSSQNDPNQSVDIDSWVDTAQGDNAENEMRQAMRAILYAVGASDSLREKMVLKGGLLLALRYGTGRHTKDIDFSTAERIQVVDVDQFIARFSESLESVLGFLGGDIDCRCQAHDIKPPRKDASFPTLRLKVGYARRGTKQHTRLLNGKASNVVLVDYSFNEKAFKAERFHLGLADGADVVAYSLVDQVSEKYRAMIQQTDGRRGRVRRQDAYDIYAVLKQGYLQSDEDRQSVLQVLRQKCAARELLIDQDTINEPEIRQRSKREYGQLADEVETPLPDFDEVYELVTRYYGGLPW